jgi:hypothetical protein
MTDPRIIGEAKDLSDLVEIYRARKAELGLTNKWFDDYSGLAQGAIGKVLGEGATKRLGYSTIPTLNCTMALKFLVVVDEDQVKFVEGRWIRRERPIPIIRAQASNRAIERFKPIITQIKNKENAPKGGKARWANVSPEHRSRLKRRAAKARWKAKREEREASRQATSPAILAMDDPSRQVD